MRPARLPKVNWPERESTLYCVHPVLTPVFVNTGRFKLGREALYSTNVGTELTNVGTELTNVGTELSNVGTELSLFFTS